MINLVGATVTKSGKTILDHIDVVLGERRIGIIGHNGSGKSTFAKLMNGLETCSSGSVNIDGLGDNSHASPVKVGFVFQNPDNQIVFPVVGEDIAFGLKKSGLSKDEIKNRVGVFLDKFGLRNLTDSLTHELSGGEKQIVALIGVLIMEPEYIVLDEPTTLLDLKNRSLLLAILSKLKQNLIIISHDLELMEQMNRVLLIDEGKVIQDGNPSSVIAFYRRMSELTIC